jgi:putative tryptophan/tyrosine transport system substrate-binding protein
MLCGRQLPHCEMALSEYWFERLRCLVLSFGGAMRRREFITLLGGAAAFPGAARSQDTAVPVVGFLSAGSPVAFEPAFVAFRHGLDDMGFVSGRVAIESRWAEGQNDRLPELASDLVRARVSVLVAAGPPAALAAKNVVRQPRVP